MVDESDLKEGACFVTATKQMRKIIKIDSDTITYESWSARQERPQSPSHTPVKKEKFLEDVERAVPCHYREGFGPV